MFREGNGLGGWETLRRNVPEAELELFRLTDNPINFRPYAVRNSNGISATSENPEAAIQFLNWMYGEQANFDLMKYGMEGEHWENIGPNEREILKRNDQGAVAYQLPNWMAGNVSMARLTPGTHPTYKKILTEVLDDAENSIALGFNFDPTPVSVQYSNILSEMATTIYPLRLGLLDYEDFYPEALDRLNTAGLQEVVAEYDRQLQEWLNGKGE